jgi:hypothetical protein
MVAIVKRRPRRRSSRTPHNGIVSFKRRNKCLNTPEIDLAQFLSESCES